jgi:hypothetical protein
MTDLSFCFLLLPFNMSDSCSLWLHCHTCSNYGDCLTTLCSSLTLCFSFSLSFWLLVVAEATLRLALCFSTHACSPCHACASPIGSLTIYYVNSSLMGSCLGPFLPCVCACGFVILTKRVCDFFCQCKHDHFASSRNY